MTDDGEIFSSMDAVKLGWRTTLANPGPLLAIGAVGGFLSLVHQSLASHGGGGPLLGMGVQVLQALVTMTLVRVSLKLYDGERIEWSRLGELCGGFFPYLLTSVLYGVIVAGGLLLLIVPGIVWAVTYGYATFVAVETGMFPIEALNESRRLTRGHRWQLLRFGLLLLGVNLLGAMALGIGLFVTIPTTMIAAAAVFRRLQASATEHAPARFHRSAGTPATSH